MSQLMPVNISPWPCHKALPFSHSCVRFFVRSVRIQLPVLTGSKRLIISYGKIRFNKPIDQFFTMIVWNFAFYFSWSWPLQQKSCPVSDRKWTAQKVLQASSQKTLIWSNLTSYSLSWQQSQQQATIPSLSTLWIGLSGQVYVLSSCRQNW